MVGLEILSKFRKMGEYKLGIKENFI